MKVCWNYISNHRTEGEVIYMKKEKLKIGNTYYMSSCSRHSVKLVVLLKIVDSKHVLLRDKKGREFTTNVSKLHTTPDKAVDGRRRKEAVKREMNKQKEHMIRKEKESLVAKPIQKRVRELRKKAFATIENNVYVIKGYVKELRFDTLDELVSWLDSELEQWKKFKSEILLKQYKILKVDDDNGGYSYFYKLGFDFAHRELGCRKFEGDISEFAEEQILDGKEIPDIKVIIRD